MPEGIARPLLLNLMTDLLRQVAAVRVRRTVAIDSEYRQATGWQVPAGQSLGDAYETLRHEAETTVHVVPDLAGVLHRAVSAMEVALDPLADLAMLWARFTTAVVEMSNELDVDATTTDTCLAQVQGCELLIIVPITAGAASPVDLTTPQYLQAVSELLCQVRRVGLRPTVTQLLAEHTAYELLARGARLPSGYRTWGTSGFRCRQTYMSVTDPGHGHLDGTLREIGNLDGVIVHIEHLERGLNQDRTAVEPYRIPNPLTVANVRLALGADAPSSSYVGRPVFETEFHSGFLKTVHTMAAACSDLFAAGLTECKIAIESMTATQAVVFMRALAAAVRRDRSSQILSAAFNLNTEIVDDRPTRHHEPDHIGSVNPRFSAGLLGIELTVAGGFDKVTWDGTADAYPSGCVLQQITAMEALILVHRAHENGLLTYFSAGFRFEHLPLAVNTGVDGVGVGGAQILRYMDKQTGNHGPFMPGNILQILAIRNQAQTEPRGRAAAVLSRLDRMYFEGAIGRVDDQLRERLFAALLDEDAGPGDLLRVLHDVRHIEQMAPDHDHSLIAWVRRLEHAGSESLFARTRDDWRGLLDRLSRAADHNDLDHLWENSKSLRARTTFAAVTVAA